MLRQTKNLPLSYTNTIPPLPIKAIPQPLAHGPQTLPPHAFVRLAHQLHNPPLQPQLLELAPLLRYLPNQTPHVIARDGQDLLVVIPTLAEDLRQQLGQLALVGVEDLAGVLAPEGGVAVGGAPAQVAALQLGGVFVKGRLGAGVVFEHGGEGGEVLEEVRVGEVAAFEVLEEGGEAGGYGEGEEGGAVGGGGEDV